MLVLVRYFPVLGNFEFGKNFPRYICPVLETFSLSEKNSSPGDFEFEQKIPYRYTGIDWTLSLSKKFPVAENSAVLETFDFVQKIQYMGVFPWYWRL